MKVSLSWIGDFVDTAAAGGAEGAQRLLEQAGFPLESLERLDRNAILDVEITPNRPDAMSHRGLAREIAAMAGLPFLIPSPLIPSPPAPGGEGQGEGGVRGPAVHELTSVTIEVPRLCRRFGARVVRGISGAPAVESVRSRLSSIGAKPISAAVDATNYVLWETGQPLHAFDLDKLAGGRVVVRRAHKGEKLVLLDGAEYELVPSDVVVADAERTVSLAGIMGGLDTAVTGETRNVLLEAAWWDPAAIRKTARRLSLHTDASHRFERGADPEAIPEALDRAAKILLESAGGTLAAGRIDARGAAWKARKAFLRLARLRLLAGEDKLDLDFAAQALSRLGFAVSKRGKRLQVGIPTFRPDVSIEDDLVEEVLRVYGYHRLPSRLPPTRGGGGCLEPLRQIEEAMADGAVAIGLYETMASPFVDRATEEKPFFQWTAAAGGAPQPLSVANPLDQARRDLRSTLIPGLLDSVARNVHHGERTVGLFEVGRVFDRPGDPADPPSFESRRFAFGLTGDWRGHWSAGGPSGRSDFFDAKGVFERLVSPWMEAESIRWKPFAADGFVPDAAALAETPAGAALGVVGLLSRSEREKRKLAEAVFAGEIRVEAIPRRGAPARFEPYSAFPPIEADLSFAHSRERTWQALEEFVRAQNLAGLDSIRLVDRYEGPGVEEGRVKTTIRLTFRAPDRTLEQEEVNREARRLVGQLTAHLGVVFG
jgi:phenylalanyl-tRNA synthetase beta chain